MNTELRADALLAECETAEEVRALVAGLLDTLLKVKGDCQTEIEHMDSLEEDGEQPTAAYVADALQDLIYVIEENL